MRETTFEMSQPPRSDARHNRLRILQAARAAFAADGLDVPVREIARLAGVAPATIYRHFPARAELTHAVLTSHVSACAADMQSALADPDPGRALRTTIENFARRQVRQRGLNQALLGPDGLHGPFAAHRRAHARAFEQLVDRASAAGHIRPGLTADDLRAGLIAITSIDTHPDTTPNLITERLVKLIFAAIHQ